MKYVICILFFVLTACASEPPSVDLVADKKVFQMSRGEIISAIHECETSNTRAVMVYAKRKVNEHVGDIVIDVTCAPKPLPRF